MAGPEKKQQRKRGRFPPLDDISAWLTLTSAHRTYSQRLDGVDFSPAANNRMSRAMATEMLPCMRENIATGEREYMKGSFWKSPQTVVDAIRSSNAVSRAKSPGPVFGWMYYVGKLRFNEILKPLEEISAGERATGEETPAGRKAKGDWKSVVTREVIQRLEAGKKFPTRKDMLDFCSTKIRHAPDPSDMGKHLKDLQGKKN